jgi:CubicO group peptidase (beta-lactamase class C family)
MKHLVKFLVIAVTALFFVSHVTLADEKFGSEIELSNQIEHSLHNESLIGVVWSTVSANKIAQGAKGYADFTNLKPMTTANKVQTGSIVKTLIATGVLHLVTDKKLSLDTPVTEILPDIGLQNPWALNTPVRVRHLLDHTSGLEDIRLWQLLTTQAKPDTALKETFTESQLRIRNRPGSRLSYSNLGYAILAMVIEAVVKERYESYLDKHLLEPLGMHMSTFNFVSQVGQFSDPALAMGHFENGVSQATLPMFLRPAGQFTTTAYDMALFAQFLMGDGKINDRIFIEPTLLTSMGKPFKTEATLNNLTDIGYALGVTTRDRHNVVGKCHSGSTLGYRTNFCFFPEQQKAFFIAFNADVETANYKQFDSMLISNLGVNKANAIAPSKAQVALDDWQGFYTLSPNRMKRFAYFDRLLHFATVSSNGETLTLSPFQSQQKTLLATGGNLFREETKRFPSHTLYISENGQHMISDGFRTYEQTSLWKLLPMWLSLAIGVIAILWILVYGAICLVKGQLCLSSPLLLPFTATLFLFVPLPLFLTQSFLNIGEFTLASALLALATTILPFAMTYGLWRIFTHEKLSKMNLLNSLAMVAALQWSLILALWGVFPLLLWS